MNPPFELDLATHHALNILYPVSPLELCLSISSQSLGFLPKLPLIRGDSSVMGDWKG